jgi:hypothetical protein
MLILYLSYYLKGDKKKSQRGAKPLLIKNLPLPLDKGKGIKGIGLINNYA